MYINFTMQKGKKKTKKIKRKEKKKEKEKASQLLEKISKFTHPHA